MSILDVGSSELSDKRIIEDGDRPGHFSLMHNLESFDYLKLEPSNFIYFHCSDLNNQIFEVQQEYLETNKFGDTETKFMTIYSIKICKMLLKDAMTL